MIKKVMRSADQTEREVLTLTQRKVVVSVQHRGASEIVEVAQAARVSVAGTRYALSTLEERGVLVGCAPFINVYPLGFVSTTLYLSFIGLSQVQHKALIHQLLKNPSVSWIGKLVGAFEYAVSFLTRTGQEVFEAISGLSEAQQSVISRKATTTTCAFYAYARRYLAPEVPTPPPLYFGFGEPPAQIDELDTRILEAMSAKGITSHRKLALQLGVAHTTVSRRIADLEQKNIIRAVITRFDMTRFHLSTYRLLLYTAGTYGAVRDALKHFAQNELYVLRAMEVLGPWDYELEIEVPNVLELNDLVVRLKQKLARSLSQVETVQILHHLMFKPFPRAAQAR